MKNLFSPRVIRNLLILTGSLLVMTLAINRYLAVNLERYEKKVRMVTAPSATREQLLVPDLRMASDSAADFIRSPLETFREDMRSMDRLMEGVRQERKGADRKKSFSELASLWDSEMVQIVSSIGMRVDESERAKLMESQNVFLEQRNHETMKEISDEKTGIDENIDYMNRYIEVTRQRCLDLIKDYEGYLAT